jgi:hypothetical protein
MIPALRRRFRLEYEELHTRVAEWLVAHGEASMR